MSTPGHPTIINRIALAEPDDSTYAGSDELLSIRSSFSQHFGFQRLGIHHERIPPGRRTSFPHAESMEEEFVYVISGTPDVWIDGHLYALQPGDGVGFVPGTGHAHTFINNSTDDVCVMVVGEATRADNRIHYPLHPDQNERKGARWWADAPRHDLGPHDGRPDEISTVKA